MGMDKRRDLWKGVMPGGMYEISSMLVLGDEMGLGAGKLVNRNSEVAGLIVTAVEATAVRVAVGRAKPGDWRLIEGTVSPGSNARGLEQ